jgi:hypothetical protein
MKTRKLLLLVALFGILFASWSPASSQACLFCNLTGYVNCESTNGTACGVPGTSKRCWINPACACEWGVCRCDGTTNTWNCIW